MKTDCSLNDSNFKSLSRMKFYQDLKAWLQLKNAWWNSSIKEIQKPNGCIFSVVPAGIVNRIISFAESGLFLWIGSTN